ncbi:hypothetical protein EES46_31490 [Streptomyces sp. ADI98-10]|nr:hypothetical protein EES46_31490 [Streptomyces sp. ADI98-10]
MGRGAVTVRRTMPSNVRESTLRPVMGRGFPRGVLVFVSQSWTASPRTTTASRPPSSEKAMSPSGCPNRVAPGTSSLGSTPFRSRTAPSHSSSQPDVLSTARNRPSREKAGRPPGSRASRVLRTAPPSRVTSIPEAVTSRSLSWVNTASAVRSLNCRIFLRFPMSQTSWMRDIELLTPNFIDTRDRWRPFGETARCRGRWFVATGTRWRSLPFLTSRTTTSWSLS